MAKIESLEIEARGLSVPVHKARQPWTGKGNTAEVGNLPEGFLLVRQRTSAGLSQTFVESYRLQWGFILLGMDIAVGSL